MNPAVNHEIPTIPAKLRVDTLIRSGIRVERAGDFVTISFDTIEDADALEEGLADLLRDWRGIR